MGNLRLNASLVARQLFPNRTWFPIEAWDDSRYNSAFPSMKTQPDELRAQREAASNINGPLFSIVVPLYRTPHDYLDDMVRSVLEQTYPNWELILVNASPERDDLTEWVQQYCDIDNRIKHIVLPNNYGITENTNHGIKAATGDFISFMDHDDWIEPDILFEYAAAIHANENADLLYCDEDMVERQKGSWHYFHPLFKPDYSPELLICKNYVLHMLTVRKTVLDSLPTPGSEYDGAQDYNMTLRAAEAARYVHHIPKVLYHWRVSEQSTATNSSAKPYGKRAYRRSVNEHLNRMNLSGSLVTAGVVNNYNVWFHPGKDKRISLIVVRGDETAGNSFETFLDAFNQVNSYSNVEVLIVDTDEPSLLKDSWPMIDCVQTIKASDNANILERFNLGANKASGSILVFLDSSCIYLSPEPIEQLIGMHERSGMGIVGPKVLYSDLTVKSYGIGVSQQGIVPLYRNHQLDYPSYQCNTRTFLNASATGLQGLSISKSLFEKIGGFDTNFSGEIGAVMLCGKASEQGFRTVATCTVQLLTSEPVPTRLFDEHYGRADYPQEEVNLLKSKLPSAQKSHDPYRGPYLNQSSSYPVINYATN